MVYTSHCSDLLLTLVVLGEGRGGEKRTTRRAQLAVCQAGYLPVVLSVQSQLELS